jgi:hypothetical protein
VVKAGCWSPVGVIAALLLAACGAPPTLGGLGVPTKAQPNTDAATRSSPVIVGRPARGFVFAALGARCEPLEAPEITVTVPPAKGALSFKPGQPTIIATSAKGTCSGRDALGTGMYYDARAGSEGLDRFTVTAHLASGETITRDFEVRIEQ